jgi:predicted glycoside hydrolase/deacetylase ChbG (UPF0249 family)
MVSLPSSKFKQATAKGVILCADDFCVNVNASLGIVKLASLGRISATSVMVLSPRWPTDAASLADLRDRIDVGLHLDWTSDFALAAGHGMSLGAAMLKAMLGGFGRAATRAVIERQLDLFEAHWGAPPDYVDGHQHVQQFAGIREELVQALISRYGGRGRPLSYLRISRAPVGTADLKGWVIAAMGAAALEKLAAHSGITAAKALSGIYDFSGDPARYAALMVHWLNEAPAGAIIMCHPAQAAEPGDAIGSARVQEFNYLMGPEFAAALVRAQVQLVRGSGCPLKSASDSSPD